MQIILLSKKQNLETSLYLEDIFNKSNTSEDFQFICNTIESLGFSSSENPLIFLGISSQKVSFPS